MSFVIFYLLYRAPWLGRELHEGRAVHSFFNVDLPGLTHNRHSFGEQIDEECTPTP